MCYQTERILNQQLIHIELDVETLIECLPSPGVLELISDFELLFNEKFSGKKIKTMRANTLISQIN